jgi:plastocyanin
MKNASRRISRPGAWFAAVAMLMAGAGTTTVQAEDWQANVGGESLNLGSQALAFLPNELWIHTGDSIHWKHSSTEIHTVTFLMPGQIRPPNFAMFGVPVGCPGSTPDGASFDGSACVNSGILGSDQNIGSNPSLENYSVQFPAAGNFKFVCLVHVDMTGVVHVLNPSETLPHDQAFYDREAENDRTALVEEATRLAGGRTAVDDGQAPLAKVTAGVGKIVTTTGAGTHTVSLSRFLRNLIVVRVGNTVEWTNLDPSTPHTVTFGAEPADPRPPSPQVTIDSDGARHGIIGSPADSLNSGLLVLASQDRTGLAQSPPGPTRFRVTFTTPGTFDYICSLHDNLGMKGTVIVQP